MERPKKLLKRKLRELRTAARDVIYYGVSAPLDDLRRAVERLQYTVYVTSQDKPESDVSRSMVRIDYADGQRRYFDINDVTVVEKHDPGNGLLVYMIDGGSLELSGEPARRVEQALDKTRVKLVVEVYGE